MIITFFSDPHLGVQRQANTTSASAAALQQAVYFQARDIVDSAPGRVICLGDVFDKYSNPEHIQRQGFNIVSKCDLVLAGNHDVVSREGQMGSLQMVDYALNRAYATGARKPSPCKIVPFSQYGVAVDAFNEARLQITSIPHVATQDLFEQALGEALGLGPAPDGYAQMLLLHCNYNMPPDIATETSLNLIDEHIAQLLEVYHFILLGHEHGPAQTHDGRVIRLGNTHPTGFADISDKFIALWDTEKEEFSFEKVWDAGKGYLEVDCGAVPESTQAQFVRITGRATSETLLQTYKAVERLWKSSPGLYGVKMVLERAEAETSGAPALPGQPWKLTDLVEADLKGEPGLLALWQDLAAEAGEGL